MISDQIKHLQEQVDSLQHKQDEIINNIVFKWWPTLGHITAPTSIFTYNIKLRPNYEETIKQSTYVMNEHKSLFMCIKHMHNLTRVELKLLLDIKEFDNINTLFDDHGHLNTTFMFNLSKEQEEQITNSLIIQNKIGCLK